MKLKTIPSDDIEGFERATQLGFDTAYYEAVCGNITEGATEGVSYIAQQTFEKVSTSVRVNSYSPTQAIATNEIQQLGRRFAGSAAFNP